jgi:peptidoglycan/LPS O-acetylase OafA/YrhL
VVALSVEAWIGESTIREFNYFQHLSAVLWSLNDEHQRYYVFVAFVVAVGSTVGGLCDATARLYVRKEVRRESRTY